uniref:Uncharacterized protein n=1 Tax=Parascaris univalens TaxID=6257 RepID=A0A915BF46_PARUN
MCYELRIWSGYFHTLSEKCILFRNRALGFVNIAESRYGFVAFSITLIIRSYTGDNG